jgi:hypothetical protein
VLEDPPGDDAGGYCSRDGIGADLRLPAGKEIAYVDEGWSWLPPETSCRAYAVDASGAGPYVLLAAGSYPDTGARTWLFAISLLPMAAWACFAFSALAARRREADPGRSPAPPC